MEAVQAGEVLEGDEAALAEGQDLEVGAFLELALHFCGELGEGAATEVEVGEVVRRHLPGVDVFSDNAEFAHSYRFRRQARALLIRDGL